MIFLGTLEARSATPLCVRATERGVCDQTSPQGPVLQQKLLRPQNTQVWGLKMII